MVEQEREAWQREKERLQADDPGMSMKELAAEFGLHINTIAPRILQGVQEGRYLAGMAYRTDARGCRRRVPVYRLNPKFKEPMR